MKRYFWIIFSAIFIELNVINAGIHFGLGKAAAKKSAEVIDTAATQASSSSSTASSTGTTPSSFSVSGPSYTWTNAGPSTFTITALDDSSNTLTVTADTLINLAHLTYLSYGQSQANGIFCRDVNCAYQITQTTITSGSSSVSFYYLNAATGTAILSVSLSNSSVKSFPFKSLPCWVFP